MKTILGIDPGTRFVGWATGEEKPEACGVINIPKGKKITYQDKVRYLAGELKKLMLLYKPEYLVVEDQFVGVNRRVCIVLSKWAGIIIGICSCFASWEMEIIDDMKPCEWKEAVSGYGAASKEHIRNLYGQESEDAADACGILEGFVARLGWRELEEAQVELPLDFRKRKKKKVEAIESI